MFSVPANPHFVGCLNCGLLIPASTGFTYCSPGCHDAHLSGIAAGYVPCESVGTGSVSSGSFAADVEANSCQCCQSKSAAAGTECCSKRCSWFVQCRCPQCGRERGSNFIYCSLTCASQAAQANWCSACGVRQMIAGSATCGYWGCPSMSEPAVQAAAQNFFGVRQRQMRPISNKRASAIRHEVLPAEDKMFHTLAALFSSSLGSFGTVFQIVKITPDTIRRKVYLSYRSQVEQIMTQCRAVKYGHGGEGNEQRRYFPFSSECCLGLHDGNREIQCCQSATCDICTLLQQGFSLQRMHRGSHYSTTTVSVATPWCAPSPTVGVKALVVARAVVGVANLLHTDDEGNCPPIEVPVDMTAVHSTVVTDGRMENDGLYVFRDDAVDPLFIVLFY